MKDSRERLRNFLAEQILYRSDSPIPYRIIRDEGEDLVLAFEDLTDRGTTPDNDDPMDCQVIIGGRRLG